ncbi:Thyroid adenoma-associated-like protein, partial [Armadillidium nasatum]
SLQLLSTRFSSQYFPLVKTIFTSDSDGKNATANKLILLVENNELIILKTEQSSNVEIYHKIFETSVNFLIKQWKYSRSYQTTTAETNEIFQFAQQVVRYLTIFMEKRNNLEHNGSDTTKSLFHCLLEIISAEVTPLDLRISCGLLLNHIMLKDHDYSVIFEKAFCSKYPFDNVETVGILSVFHGLLCHIDGKLLFSLGSSDIIEEKENDRELASKMLNRVCHVINTAQIGSVAVLGARTLNLLMVKLLDCFRKENMIKKIYYLSYSIHSNNSRKIQDALWFLWDHYLDCVKHIARETFTVFINLQIIVNEEQAMSYFHNLSCSFVKSLQQQRSSSILSYLVPFVGVCSMLETDTSIVNILLKQLSDPFHSTQASNLLETLFTKHYSEVENNEWYQFWLTAFFSNFSKESLVYGFESLLGKLLQIGKNTVNPISLITNRGTLTDDDICLLMICTKLQIKNFWKEEEEGTLLWKGILSYEHLNNALTRGDETLCILTFSLLAENPKSTELFNERELKLIMNILKQNIVSQNPSFRQKLLHNFKKVFNRIKCGISSKFKKSTSLDENSQRLKNIHLEFVCNLFIYLKSNLFNGANYSRRSLSLLILEPLFDLLEEEAFLHLKGELFTSDLAGTLLLCLSDSYEANKQLALKHLLRIITGTNFFANKSKTEALLDSAWILASSSKPPDSMTANYILKFLLNLTPIGLCDEEIPSPTENRRLVACWCILKKIEAEYNVAKKSILKASVSGPMYGLLLCLRGLISDLNENEIKSMEQYWSKLFQEIVKICNYIASTSLGVVKNASPEGFLPVEKDCSEIYSETVRGSFTAQECNFIEEKKPLTEEELIKAQGITAQMVLLCGWRSIKEIALLYGLLVQGSPSFPDSLMLMSVDDVKSIGNILMTLLTETKHRGAFEQTYNGFEMVCATLWKCSDKEMNKLPSIWLNDTLTVIQSADENNRLCATRRSAGIPFIVQAIVSSEPSVLLGSCLKNTMSSLLTLAASDSQLETRVHALNILRALYRDTRIGEEVLPYVSDGVKVALDGYKSKSWSVRNSSSLMFSSIVTRMFGVKKTQEDLHSKNAVSALVFFKRYPELYDFILENLSSSVQDMKNGDMSVATFPTFLILARFSPPSSDGFSTSIPLAPFIPYVMKFSGSPAYHLRSLASKALIPLISSTTSLLNVTENLCSSLSFQNQNHLHGILLCLTQILKSFSSTITSCDDLRIKMKNLYSQVMWAAFEINHCYFTRSCAIDLFNLIVKENIFPCIDIKSLTASTFALLLNMEKQNGHSPGEFLAIRSATDFFLTVNQKYYKKNIAPFLQTLNFRSPQVLLVTLEHLSSFYAPTDKVLNKKIISFVTTVTDSNCWMLAADLICKFVSQFCKKELDFYKTELENIFSFLFSKISSERSEDVITLAIKLSGTILQAQVKYFEENGHVDHWLDFMSNYANVDCALSVRLAVAESLSTLLHVLQPSKIEGSTEVLMFDILIEFLVDDDKDVRDTASRGCSMFLQKFAHEDDEFENFVNNTNWPPSLVTKKIFYYLGAKRSITHFTCLIGQALKEELPEVFGLSQEEDRAFDKGETKIFKEDIYICRMISKSILKVHNKKGEDYFNSIHLSLKSLEDYLLLPIPKKFYNEESKNYTCSISEFLVILKREIIFILDVFKELSYTSPFKMKNFDLWVERLAKRAFLWEALKKYGSESFDEEELLSLKTCLIKPYILNCILNSLTLT